MKLLPPDLDIEVINRLTLDGYTSLHPDRREHLAELADADGGLPFVWGGWSAGRFTVRLADVELVNVPLAHVQRPRATA